MKVSALVIAPLTLVRLVTSRHTIAPISYYSFPVLLRVGGWVGLSTNNVVELALYTKKKPFIVSKMTVKVTQDHRRRHRSLESPGLLSETEQVGCPYFRTQIAEMTLTLQCPH